MTRLNSSVETLVLIEQYLSVYGQIILTSAGIIGNILSILIFLSPRYRRQSSHFYLLCLALSDLCFLIINFLQDTFRNHNHLYRSRINFLDRSSSFVCISVEYARNVTRFLSSWIVVSFTIERLLVVFHPLRRAFICRRKIARLVVLIVFIISLLSNLNVPFHYKITKLVDSNQNDTICDILPRYQQIYIRFAIITMIVVYLLPMCIIGMVNMLICCKLWRKSSLMEKDEAFKLPKERHRIFHRRSSSYITELLTCINTNSSMKSSSSSLAKNQIQQRRNSSFSQYHSIGPLLHADGSPTQLHGNLMNDEIRQQRPPTQSLSHGSLIIPTQPKYSVCSVKSYIQSRTHRVTATLLLVSCSFLLLNTPYCALWIANYIHDFRNTTLRSIKEITELLMLTNFCINFLLYCVSGKVFRSELLCLLRCRWRELYEKGDGDRLAHRKSRPKIEIKLKGVNPRSRSISLFKNDQQHQLSVSLFRFKCPSR